MFRNYLKIAIRNLWKNKVFSLINILGLAIGVTTFLLISLYVVDELSYDRHFQNADRIFRINADIKFGGDFQKTAVASDALGHTLKKDYPFIEEVARFRDRGSMLIKTPGKNENIEERKILFADSTLFDVFSLEVLAGNRKTALVHPNTIAISKSAALKYFNKENAVGETLVIDNKTNYKITAVFKDLPKNTHFDTDFFITMEDLDESKQGSFLSHNFNTYVLLKEGTSPAMLQGKFREVLLNYLGPQAKQVMGVDLKDLEAQGNFLHYTLIPLKDIHLHSNRIAELGANGDIQFVYIFSAIAFFVLLIACINFMNLSTARSANRAKEVGVRKVLGSLKGNLINQFLSESILLSFIAFTVATFAAIFLLPAFNHLAGKEIEITSMYLLTSIPVLLLLTFLTGLIAGSYPAFYLSSFKPIAVLKGKLSGGFKNGYFRSSLVVFQFAMSTILIIGTLVIYQQLKYIQSKDLGFNKEQLITIKNTHVLGDKQRINTFKNEMLRNKGVVNGTIAGYLPVPSSRSSEVFYKGGVIDQNNAISMQVWGVDHDYISTFGMKILKGRDFSKEMLTDSGAVIINEAAAALLELKDPVGEKLGRLRISENQVLDNFTIIGVVKNFHFESLRDNIIPLCISMESTPWLATFKIKSENLNEVLSKAEKLWKEMAPGQPFSYSFVNEGFEKMYEVEQKTGNLLAIFAGLAIFIACLGLFGLATYASEQRTKEIGIRKVLGANITNVVTMLSKDFLKLVIIAFILAIPVSWYMMNSWLQDFAYRINISWGLFAIAGVLAIAIAIATVSFQAIKAAIANPVKSLRTE